MTTKFVEFIGIGVNKDGRINIVKDKNIESKIDPIRDSFIVMKGLGILLKILVDKKVFEDDDEAIECVGEHLTRFMKDWSTKRVVN